MSRRGRTGVRGELRSRLENGGEIERWVDLHGGRRGTGNPKGVGRRMRVLTKMGRSTDSLRGVAVGNHVESLDNLEPSREGQMDHTRTRPSWQSKSTPHCSGSQKHGLTRRRRPSPTHVHDFAALLVGYVPVARPCAYDYGWVTEHWNRILHPLTHR